jgi:hypothetical protein
MLPEAIQDKNRGFVSHLFFMKRAGKEFFFLSLFQRSDFTEDTLWRFPLTRVFFIKAFHSLRFFLTVVKFHYKKIKRKKAEKGSFPFHHG